MGDNDFIRGSLESGKFSELREPYAEGLNKIKALEYSFEDIIHNFPAFAGQMTLARFFSIYDCYRQTLGVCGHMAEIGVYKGACSILLAKLTQLYEPYALTQVHGFDWFRGTGHLSVEERKHLIDGTYCEPRQRLEALIQAQHLSNIVKLHEIDMGSAEVSSFFNEYQHMMFKLVIFDAGVYKVVRNALPYFWERLTVGGIMIFDQLNFELAPGETKAVREVLPGAKLRTFPNGWMPTAYVVKE